MNAPANAQVSERTDERNRVNALVDERTRVNALVDERTSERTGE